MSMSAGEEEPGTRPRARAKVRAKDQLTQPEQEAENEPRSRRGTYHASADEMFAFLETLGSADE